MSKRKSSRQQKRRGETLMLTLSRDLKTWLVDRTKRRGASTVQESVRQILIDARTSEQQQQSTL